MSYSSHSTPSHAPRVYWRAAPDGGLRQEVLHFEDPLNFTPRKSSAELWTEYSKYLERIREIGVEFQERADRRDRSLSSSRTTYTPSSSSSTKSNGQEVNMNVGAEFTSSKYRTPPPPPSSSSSSSTHSSTTPQERSKSVVTFLKFLAFFVEPVKDVNTRKLIERKHFVYIHFYPFDNSIEITELASPVSSYHSDVPVVRQILKRHSVCKPSSNGRIVSSNEVFTIRDFCIGAKLKIYNRCYEITDMEKSTQRYFLDHGLPTSVVVRDSIDTYSSAAGAAGAAGDSVDMNHNINGDSMDLNYLPLNNPYKQNGEGNHDKNLQFDRRVDELNWEGNGVHDMLRDRIKE